MKILYIEVRHIKTWLYANSIKFVSPMPKEWYIWGINYDPTRLAFAVTITSPEWKQPVQGELLEVIKPEWEII